MLANLGLTDAVKSKTKLSKGLEEGQAQIARGEIEVGLFNLSEIPRAPGVVRAGPVPAEVEVYINYDAACLPPMQILLRRSRFSPPCCAPRRAPSGTRPVSKS